MHPMGHDLIKHANLGGSFNPSEKYARQIGSWNPRDRGENSKNIWVATT